MWAKYTYIAGSTASNIFNDVIAILTGTTDVATLSASCDKASSVINVTYDTAGWMLHDAAVGTNKVCLKSGCAQDDNQFKYVLVDGSIAGYFGITLHESWNATSHIGTNQVSGTVSNSYQQRVNVSAGGTLYISSSVRRLVIFGSSSSGSGNNTGAPTCIFEVDTGFSWCGAGQGFVPAGQWPLNYGLMFTRQLAKNGNVLTQATNGLDIMSVFGNITNGDNSISFGAPMSGGQWATPVSPLFAGGGFGNSSTPLVSGLAITGLFYVAGGALFLDEVAYNGKTYVAIPTGSSSGRMLCPKG